MTTYDHWKLAYPPEYDDEEDEDDDETDDFNDDDEDDTDDDSGPGDDALPGPTADAR